LVRCATETRQRDAPERARMRHGDGRSVSRAAQVAAGARVALRCVRRRCATRGATRAFLKSRHAASQSGLPSPAAAGARASAGGVGCGVGRATKQLDAPAATAAPPRREKPRRRQRAAPACSGARASCEAGRRRGVSGCKACGEPRHARPRCVRRHDDARRFRESGRRARTQVPRRTCAGREGGATRGSSAALLRRRPAAQPAAQPRSRLDAAAQCCGAARGAACEEARGARADNSACIAAGERAVMARMSEDTMSFNSALPFSGTRR